MHSQTGAISIWTPNFKVNNLETEFFDGIMPITVVEALSTEKIPGRVKESQNHIFWLDNVLALDFLQESEKLRPINIGKDDIVAGNFKLILGLVWQLICHFYTFGDLKMAAL